MVTHSTTTQTPRAANTVNALVRVVANGTHNGRPRLTLALRPVRPAKVTRQPERFHDGALALASWPSKVEETTDNLRLEFLIAPLTCKTGKVTPAQVQKNGVDWKRVTVPLARLFGEDSNLDRTDRLWQEVMPAEPKNGFDEFFTNLPPLRPEVTLLEESQSGTGVCISGGEGDIALLTKIARARETQRLMEGDQDDVSRQIFEDALTATNEFLNNADFSAFRDLYSQTLNFGEDEEASPGAPENTIPAGEGDPLTNTAVTRNKTETAVKIALDALKDDCANARVAAEKLCEGDIATCCKVIEDKIKATGCASEFVAAELPSIYTQLLKLRARLMVARAIHEDELAKLESPESTKPPEEMQEEHATKTRDKWKKQLPANRLFGLDQIPDLGRLFRTFVDCQITSAGWTDLGAKLGKGSERFVFLRVTPNDALAKKGIQTEDAHTEHFRWSLAKIKINANGVITHFLPATREEFFLCLSGRNCSGLLSQRDGLLMLGACGPDGRPAYELVSTDIRVATQEFESRADRMMTRAVRRAANEPEWESGNPEGYQLSPSLLRSGGFSVVNFAAARQMSHREGFAEAAEDLPNDETFLDADDLMTGRVPYAAMVVQGSNGSARRIWFALSRKKVKYSSLDPDSRNRFDWDTHWIQREMQKLAPGGELSRLQLTIDQAGGRETKLKDPRDPETPVRGTVFAEEEFTYQGDPAGVETGMLQEGFKIHPLKDFNMWRKVSLPKKNSVGTSLDDLTIPLRFGMPLRVGFAASYLGGGGVTPKDAGASFDGNRDAMVPRAADAVSTDRTRQGRRHLRSEAIAPVAVLLPEYEAENVKNQLPDIRRHPFPMDTTGTIILRSFAEDTAPTKAVVERVILPPVVDLDFAEKHGVFDTQSPAIFQTPAKAKRVESVSDVIQSLTEPQTRARVRRPREGLRDLAFDAAWGGVPVLAMGSRTAEDGRRAFVSAQTSDGKSDWLPKHIKWVNDGRPSGGQASTPSGDGVFRRRRWQQQKRTTPFYPDPMANGLVLRLRRDSDRPGEAGLAHAIVPFVQAADYPDVVPIVLRVAHGETATITDTATTKKIDEIDCRVVNVTVPPGETLDLDCWAAPNTEALAFWSELTDTISTLDKATCVPEEDACGLLGRPAPSQAELEAQARKLHGYLCKRPLPELSKTRTIAITYAVEKPLEAPKPVLIQDESNPIYLRRALDTPSEFEDDSPMGADVLDSPAHLPDGWYHKPGELMNAVPRATEADVGGYLQLHLPTTGSLEIEAFAAAPDGAAFDDISRSRSREQRRDGVFPRRPNSEKWMSADEVYGFRLNEDGTAAPLKSEALWARMRKIPDDTSADNPTGLISLHALFGPRPKQPENAKLGENPIEAEITPLFVDTKARKIALNFRSVSRHSTAFLRRGYVSGKLFRPPVPVSRENGRFKVLPPVTDENKQTVYVNETGFAHTVWLPASERPAAPKPAAEAHPVEGEVTTQLNGATQTASSRRITKTRLWLERPWWSSGEGEKLGIVLWPRVSGESYESLLKYILSRNFWKPNAYKSTLTFPRPSIADSGPDLTSEDMMKLNHFRDQYMKDAAPFFSRWGSDPIEGVSKDGWMDWVIPCEIFADFQYDKQRNTLVPLIDHANFVPNVKMPIPVAEDTVEKKGRNEPTKDSSDVRGQRYPNVDLICYTPRFDIDREQWYVDVALDAAVMVSPFVRLGAVRYQKHAPRDLQLSFPAQPFECQVMPRRLSKVTRSRDGADKTRLSVTISGPATSDPQDEAAFVNPQELSEEKIRVKLAHDAASATRMHVHLIGRNTKTGALEITLQQRLAPTKSPEKTEALTMEWSGHFTLPNSMADRTDLSLSLHIEERVYRATTSPDPADADFNEARTGEKLSASSPRYLCVLTVPGADNK